MLCISTTSLCWIQPWETDIFMFKARRDEIVSLNSFFLTTEETKTQIGSKTHLEMTVNWRQSWGWSFGLLLALAMVPHSYSQVSWNHSQAPGLTNIPWDDTRNETRMPDMVSLAWEMNQNVGSGPDKHAWCRTVDIPQLVMATLKPNLGAPFPNNWQTRCFWQWRPAYWLTLLCGRNPSTQKYHHSHSDLKQWVWPFVLVSLLSLWASSSGHVALKSIKCDGR